MILDVLQELEPVQRLTKDMRVAARSMGRQEIRYLVDGYYTLQEYRKAVAGQIRAMSESSEPTLLLEWMLRQMEILEGQIKGAMDAWTETHPVGRWSKSITGIGPIISAGLLAHIDITKAPHVGHVWAFAGLTADATWDKGTKRPWNAELKTLCAFKIGESFVKVQNNERDFYGHLLRAKKDALVAANERGDYSDAAAAKLRDVKIGKATEAYKHYAAGHLPPAHVHARARRWVVKLFLSHWHHVAYETEYGVAPAKPYPIALLGHADYIPPPNWPVQG